MTTILTVTSNELRDLRSVISRGETCVQKTALLAKMNRRDGFSLSRPQAQFICRTEPSYEHMFSDPYRFEKARDDEWILLRV